MDRFYFVLALLAFTGSLFLGGNLKAQRISNRGVLIQDNSVRQGSATTLDFTSDFTVACSSAGQACDIDADADIYVVGEITPSSASTMPTTGLWEINEDTIQITGDADSNNDLIRKSVSDNAQRFWIHAGMYHDTTLTDGVHRYYNHNGSWASNNEAEMVTALAFTCDHLWVDTIGNAGEDPETMEIWLLKNDVQTDLTCTLDTSAENDCDDAGSAAFVVGDTYSFEVTCDGSACPLSAAFGQNMGMIAECLLD